MNAPAPHAAHRPDWAWKPEELPEQEGSRWLPWLFGGIALVAGAAVLWMWIQHGAGNLPQLVDGKVRILDGASVTGSVLPEQAWLQAEGETTAAIGSAKATFADAAVVWFGKSGPRADLRLARGRMTVEAQTPIEINTRQLRGEVPAGRVAISSYDGGSKLEVLEGRLLVWPNGAGNPVELLQGEKLELPAKKPPSAAELTGPSS
jgi:ferric-dicitrate binding protein FerR (iron transport regulator)